MSEKHEAKFQARNDAIQHTINVLAQYERAEIEEHGTKAEIAREHDLETWRIRYVRERWPDLVRWRRGNMRNPTDTDAVRDAYDDETLAAMAEQAEPVADGMGDVTVNVEFPLDEAFRAIKLLPGDLGVTIFTQVLEQSSDLPRSDLRRLFER